MNFVFARIMNKSEQPVIMIIIIFRISFIKRIGAQLQNTIGFLLNVELYNFFTRIDFLFLSFYV